MAAYTTINDPEAYFQTVLYTGDGAADHAITLGGDTDMQPDLVWIKNRDTDRKHNLYDAVRGVTKRLVSNDDGEEDIAGNGLTAFNSDGFTTGLEADTNNSGDGIVAWCWEESATSGTDIVTFTGTGGTQNISHSLSAVPEMIICKSRSAAGAWYTYHGANTSAPETDYLKLNENEATADGATVWNDTAPTTSVFTVGSAFDNTTTYVAYAFAPKQGYSKFGSYVGNGNVDGTFVYTGFRPAFLMVKATSATSAWYIYDNKRAGYNVKNYQLYPNLNNTEDTTDQVDLLSNGFKWRAITGDPNSSGRTYIYAAFAEAPFVNSEGVPCNAR